MTITSENDYVNFYIRELEMEAHLEQNRKQQETSDSEEQNLQDEISAEVSEKENVSAEAWRVSVQHTEAVTFTADAQQNLLAKAEAVYGAMTGIAETEDDSDLNYNVNRKA